jgi:hypothetical protein
VRSLELLLERYDRFLDDQPDKAGVVILDACEESKDDNLRYFQSYLLDQVDHFRTLWRVLFSRNRTRQDFSSLPIFARMFSTITSRKRLQIPSLPQSILAFGGAGTVSRATESKSGRDKKSGQGGFRPTSRTLAAVLVAG